MPRETTARRNAPTAPQALTIWVGSYTADSGRDGVGIGALRLRGEPNAAGAAGIAASAAGTAGSAAAETGAAGLAGSAAGNAASPASTAASAAGAASAASTAAAASAAAETAAERVLEWLGTANGGAPSPSFLAVHPELPVVYAVGEAAGTVAAFRQTGPARLEPLGDPWPAGSAVCHVAVDPDARFLTVTCWGDGRVLLYGLDGSGSIVSRSQAAAAADPHAALARTAPPFADRPPRQSRAHASLMLADGRVMTTDLGFDLVRVWRVEHPPVQPAEQPSAPTAAPPTPTLVLDHEITLPFGSGPRHLVQHPNGSVLVVTEYSVEVVVLAMAGPSKSVAETGSARWAIASIGPATAGGAEPGDAAAEIALSSDARFAYVSVRGSNLISTLEVDDRGALHAISDTPSGGDWPRHHVVVELPSPGGAALIVAHERSNDVVLFELDAGTGIPHPGPAQRLPVEAPTALIPARAWRGANR